MTSDLSRILMETAADLTAAHVAGRPLGPVEAEAAARIHCHYAPKPVLCECGEEADPRLNGMCDWCYRDAKGPFQLERDDGDDE